MQRLIESDIRYFFFNDTATTEIYTLSLHDALPICAAGLGHRAQRLFDDGREPARLVARRRIGIDLLAMLVGVLLRSEEHTSELQSRQYLVCRLLLEKKNTHPYLLCLLLFV